MDVGIGGLTCRIDVAAHGVSVWLAVHPSPGLAKVTPSVLVRLTVPNEAAFDVQIRIIAPVKAALG